MYKIITFSDYSAFGVQLSGRTFTASGVTKKYRRGYQGSEMDNEIKNGEGNSYTTEFRQLDPRLGRWLTIDPKMKEMPWQSPYCSMDNSPISNNDQLGDYSEKRAKRIAERGKNNNYSTKVVVNPDKEGDYGVRFRAKKDDVYYEKTQYQGKFRGIGRKGIVKHGFKESNLIDIEPLTKDRIATSEEMKEIKKQIAGTNPTGQVYTYLLNHLYYEVNAEKNNGRGLGYSFSNGKEAKMYIGQETIGGINYNSEEGLNITGKGGTKDMGKRTGFEYGEPVPFIGSIGGDLSYTTYKNGTFDITAGCNVGYVGRLSISNEGNLFIGLQVPVEILTPVFGYSAMGMAGFKFDVW